jgi:DNA-binding transcriptional regulator YhcF (GntR family)
VLPFSVSFKTGLSVHEQVVYAVKKACVTGQLSPGDPFPSVRALSQDLRINPNTAHKVVGTLVGEGLLEVRPGVGTMVSRAPAATRGQRRALLGEETERLVVEARKLSLDLQEILEAVRDRWERLDR